MPGSASDVSSTMLRSSQVLGLPPCCYLCPAVAPALLAILRKRLRVDWQVKHHVKTVDAHPSPSGGILILVTGSLQVGVWRQLLCCQPGRGVLGNRHAMCTACDGVDVTVSQDTHWIGSSTDH